jgi:hypothetical protein
MVSKRIARTAAAIAVVATVTAGSGSALAQENLGSVVTIGGGGRGVDYGDIIAMAPGVVISGGEVSNSTGIGIDSGGGSSIGAAGGGGTNVAFDE